MGCKALAPSANQERSSRNWFWLVGAVGLIGAGIGYLLLVQPKAPTHEMRLEITTPPTSDPVSIAISPDGQSIVFVASYQGASQLWLRRLDSGSTRALPGTFEASFPFWSPDNRFVGFFADRQLKTIDIENETVQALARAHGGRGGAWSPTGVIIYQPIPNVAAPLYRIPSKGRAASIWRALLL